MPAASADVLAALEALAPLRLAESWDNVGLLVDPGRPENFRRAFCTIDLTEASFEEAVSVGADLIVSYHPPIFGGLKRVRAGHLGEKLIVAALQKGITIYSPHTALDAAHGGMNDWLAQALGPGRSEPIVPDGDDPSSGAGRYVSLDESLEVGEAVERIKSYLSLSHLRLSAASEHARVSTLAVCPGAGGSVFEKVGAVDLLLTGEMRHHDVLGRRARGCSVVLTDHTNTERGYLPIFAQRFSEACAGLAVSVSRVDADPLRVV